MSNMETFQTEFPHSFESGEYGSGAVPKAVAELDIIKISMQIREKPDWHVKMNDEKIVSKWKEELSNQIEDSEAKFEYVLKELGYYLSLRDGPVEVAAVDGTWQSDSLIGEDLRQKLISEVKMLEDVPEKDKDWHPGTNEQVLDLVHPSLFCFVEGKTKVLKEPLEFGNHTDQESRLFHLLTSALEKEYLTPEETSKVVFDHTEKFTSYSKSKKYQWLPTDFDCDENGSVRITSYINNLHPDKHPELYNSIREILQRFIPLFNKVLTDMRSPRPSRLGEVEIVYKEEEKDEKPDEDDDDDASESDEDDRRDRYPEPVVIPEFSPPPPNPIVVDLKGRSLQVIVKLANIELVPDSPEYFGGVWHLEGMANEKIVASGIYYYSCDNITESRLKFRQAICEPNYEQYDDNGVYKVYGLQNEKPLNQDVGSILTKQRRCIAFPNILQHRVAPFKLEDPNRPGHRKILVFFLIDPTVRVISTARIPPQQKSWYNQEISKDLASLFPEEIAQKIASMVEAESLMTLDEAKNFREDLMKERKFFIKNNNEEYFEREFSLCEH